MDAQRHAGSFWGDGVVLYIDSSGGYDCIHLSKLHCTLKIGGFHCIKLYLKNAYLKRKKILAFKGLNFNLLKTSFKKTHLHLLLNIYVCMCIYTHMCTYVCSHIHIFCFLCCHVTIASPMPGIRTASPLGSLSLVAITLTHLLRLSQVDLP